MAEELRLKCFTCGGELERRDGGKYTCIYCSREYSAGQLKEGDKPALSTQVISLMNSADAERRHRHFDAALEKYEDIIEKDSKQVLAYWGAFLSEYGIEYIQDEKGEYVPLIHRISRVEATKSKYLQKIYSLCTPASREEYEFKVNQIEAIRAKTYEISRAQYPIDVFICCGDTPYEAEAAKKLYAELENTGKTVFLPSFSIPYKAPAEAYIFPAIESAPVMIVIADSAKSFEQTENIWSRFLAEPDKRIQVVHNDIEESEYPSKLHAPFKRRQEPININGKDWIQKCLTFVTPPSAKKGAAKAEVQDAPKNVLTEDMVRMLAMQGRAATTLPEAMAMVLSGASTGDAMGARRIIDEQFAKLGGEDIRPIADLCVELARLGRATPSERKHFMDNISNISAIIRRQYPKISMTERNVYGEIESANLLIYLAKCFGVIKDRERQCFVLDLVDVSDVYDTRIINELVTMLLSNGRNEVVNSILRGIKRLDGDSLLMTYLNCGESDESKLFTLYSVADKTDCTDNIEDDLNRFLSECEDPGLSLAVLDIMNRNRVHISALGMSGALSREVNASSMESVLQNYDKRGMTAVEVDKLISMAVEGGESSVRVVLRYLKHHAGINDLGMGNMQLILDKCDLGKIETDLFEFNMDKKIALNLLMGAIGGRGFDRLYIVDTLIDRVPTLELRMYEKLLLGGDLLKKDLLKRLAPKTAKYADASRIIESFLKGRDSDEDKREIYEFYSDFPLSKDAVLLYLDIMPESYDEAYKKHLYAFLKENPDQARPLFVKHYERLLGGYETELENIVKYLRLLDEPGIVRFVTAFKGKQDVKDRIFLKLTQFLDKPKKIVVSYNGMSCTLAQAYLVTTTDFVQSTRDVMEYFRKNGVSVSDKVIYLGGKMKFKDYVDRIDDEYLKRRILTNAKI